MKTSQPVNGVVDSRAKLACLEGSFGRCDKERAAGLEPATSSLGSWHSTTELRPRWDRPDLSRRRSIASRMTPTRDVAIYKATVAHSHRAGNLRNAGVCASPVIGESVEERASRADQAGTHSRQFGGGASGGGAARAGVWAGLASRLGAGPCGAAGRAITMLSPISLAASIARTVRRCGVA